MSSYSKHNIQKLLIFYSTGISLCIHFASESNEPWKHFDSLPSGIRNLTFTRNIGRHPASGEPGSVSMPRVSPVLSPCPDGAPGDVLKYRAFVPDRAQIQDAQCNAIQESVHSSSRAYAHTDIHPHNHPACAHVAWTHAAIHPCNHAASHQENLTPHVGA